MAPRKRVTRLIKKKVTTADIKKWVSVQRREYSRLKKGLHSTITSDQIAKLNGIGFEWVSPKSKKSTVHDEGGENLMNLNQCCFENQEPDASWEFMFEQYKKCNPNKVACASLTQEKKQQQNDRRNEGLKQARDSLS